ncbi:MAG TPA: endolytic transglycosylase MltG, partial [Flavisolibacter sp.]|nr:endolytic transglycosylase MltG [Flavisolibacter sp.]
MKRFFLIIFLLLLIGSGIAAWIVLGPATGFESPKKDLLISSKRATKKAVMDSLLTNHIITNETAFEFLANRMNYWQSIKPGRYEIKKGTSLLRIVRMLRNGQQTPVNLVITKLRTKEDFASLVGRKFETDSTQMIEFLTTEDSLKKFETTPEESMFHVLPDTYTYFWNASPSIIYQKIFDASKKFWTTERIEKAKTHGLTPLQAYILASIIEEETTNQEEKGNIASVYINRLNKNMPLQADPTVKFALKDFSLRRIYEKHTQVESPYNTYRTTGLPPGPICTPSRKTIESVLDAPQTGYLY